MVAIEVLRAWPIAYSSNIFKSSQRYPHCPSRGNGGRLCGHPSGDRPYHKSSGGGYNGYYGDVGGGGGDPSQNAHIEKVLKACHLLNQKENVFKVDNIDMLLKVSLNKA